jgi:hypothetical protein
MTENASAIHRSQPGDADALSQVQMLYARTNLIDPANDLMTWDHRRFVQREIAFRNMNIGAASRAYTYSNPDFARADGWFIDVAQNQRRLAHWFLLQ